MDESTKSLPPRQNGTSPNNVCAAGRLCGMSTLPIGTNPLTSKPKHQCIICLISTHGGPCHYEFAHVKESILLDSLPSHYLNKDSNNDAVICKLCFEKHRIGQPKQSGDKEVIVVNGMDIDESKTGKVETGNAPTKKNETAMEEPLTDKRGVPNNIKYGTISGSSPVWAFFFNLNLLVSTAMAYAAGNRSDASSSEKSKWESDQKVEDT